LLVNPSVNAPSGPIKMTSFTSRGCCCSNACRCRTHSLSLALAFTRGRPLQGVREQQQHRQQLTNWHVMRTWEPWLLPHPSAVFGLGIYEGQAPAGCKEAQQQKQQ
jgi:hypothetical protein